VSQPPPEAYPLLDAHGTSCAEGTGNPGEKILTRYHPAKVPLPASPQRPPPSDCPWNRPCGGVPITALRDRVAPRLAERAAVKAAVHRLVHDTAAQSGSQACLQASVVALSRRRGLLVLHSALRGVVSPLLVLRTCVCLLRMLRIALGRTVALRGALVVVALVRHSGSRSRGAPQM